jgi:hypothetical protein
LPAASREGLRRAETAARSYQPKTGTEVAR